MTATNEWLLSSAANLPRRLLMRHKVKNTLSQLIAHQDARLKAIGIAIQEALSNDLSPKEINAISLIEKRRTSLLNSNLEIDVIDYGAGSPNMVRKKEEMQKGFHSRATVASITKSSKPQLWSIILFKMIRKLFPNSCVELGTCVGISASYQAAALNLNAKGVIVTLEGSPAIADIAKETFDILGLRNTSVVTGPFHQTLHAVCDASKPIDFFFNDGHHDHNAVIEYFNQAMPFFSESAVVIVDDISWSTGMREAWAEIEEDERVSASVDLAALGIALIRKDSEAKYKFKL